MSGRTTWAPSRSYCSGCGSCAKTTTSCPTRLHSRASARVYTFEPVPPRRYPCQRRTRIGGIFTTTGEQRDTGRTTGPFWPWLGTRHRDMPSSSDLAANCALRLAIADVAVCLALGRVSLGQVKIQRVKEVHGWVGRVDRDVRGHVEQRLG